jgi:hypothetical protein
VEDVNRREVLRLASAAGVVALAGSLALAADPERGEAPKERKGKLRVLGVGESKIACGSTAPGEGWQPYKDEKLPGIFIDVDTSEARFKSAPVYIISVGGEAGHWEVTGGSAVYPRLDKEEKPLPLEGGFRVYLKFPPDPESVKAFEEFKKAWYVNWLAVGE